MRFLIATDIHGRKELLRNLLSKKFDWLILLGDLTNRMREMELFKLLPENSLFIPGNNEKPEGFCHGKVVEVGGVKFACIGGSLPTPFSTPFEVTEEEYARICFKLKNFDFLVSHCPPYGVLDEVGGMKIGSKAIRELVERERPRAVFSGHVHEYAGCMGFVGRIPVINPGPYGIFLEI